MEINKTENNNLCPTRRLGVWGWESGREGENLYCISAVFDLELEHE